MATRTKTDPTAERAETKRLRLRRVLTLFAGTLILLVVSLALIAPAEPFVLVARHHLENRQHDEALQWLNRAIRLDSKNGEVHFLLARTYRRLGRLDKTEKHLRQAHRLGYDQWHLEREQLIALAQDGQFDQVADQWGMLLHTAGSDGPEIGDAYVRDRLSRFMLTDAVTMLDAWMNDFPDDPQPHFQRGKIWEVIEQWQAAEDEYRTALELDPSRYDVRFRLANALMRKMKYEEAAQHLELCVEEGPPNDEAAVAWAHCCHKLGDAETARTVLDEQLEDDPRNVGALKERGELELAAGNAEAAIEYLERAVAIEDVDRELRYALAQALQRAGRTEEAQKEFAFVNEATKPVLRLGTITPRLTAEPDNVELRYEVALTNWKYKSRKEGARWLLSVLDFDPYHAPTHRTLAEHFEIMNDPARAEYHRRMAVESEKRNQTQVDAQPAGPAGSSS